MPAVFAGVCQRPVPPEGKGLRARRVHSIARGRTAYLLRAFDEQRGSRITLKILRSTTVVARMDIARPLTVDNFEGLAAVPRTDGIRFYLLSDDNYSDLQRTLLLAFDWRPR